MGYTLEIQTIRRPMYESIQMYFIERLKTKTVIKAIILSSKAECYRFIFRRKKSISKETAKICCQEIERVGGQLLPENITQEKKDRLEPYIIQAQEILSQ